MEKIVLHWPDYIAIALLVPTGIWELWYIITRHRTMSAMYQRLFPKNWDMVFGFVGLGLLIFAWFIHPAIRLIIAFFWGHITIANRETYPK